MIRIVLAYIPNAPALAISAKPTIACFKHKLLNTIRTQSIADHSDNDLLDTSIVAKEMGNLSVDVKEQGARLIQQILSPCSSRANYCFFK